MNKRLLTSTLLFLVLFTSVPLALAESENSAGDVKISNGPVTEMAVQINCTWIYDHWDDNKPLPPLTGTGWADHIMSIVVPRRMYVMIYVTDAFLKGDYFEVYEVDDATPTQATLIGITPIVPMSSDWTNDPDEAFNDPEWSSDVFTIILPPGKHYFIIREVGHNYGNGGYYMKFCPGAPVGGELIPLNILHLIAPYLTIIAVAIAGTLGLLKKRQIT